MLEAAKSVSEWDGNGAFPPVDYSRPGPLPGFANIVNTTIVTLDAEDGVWTWAGEFIDVLRP